MKKPKDLKPSTLSLHAGQRPDTDFGARATPIYQSCLLYTSPSPRDLSTSRMPSSA